jgi:hypothetical protein
MIKTIYNRAIGRSIVHLGTVLAICFLSGCSAIGLGVGSSIDNATPKYSPLKQGELINIKKGKKLIIDLNDSTEISGKYDGLEKINSIEYEKKYRYAQASLAGIVPFPQTGDSISAYYKSGAAITGVFVGFDQEPPCYPCSTMIKIQSAAGDYIGQEKLIYLPYIKSAGDSIDTRIWCDLIGQYKIPMMSQLAVNDSNNIRFLPLESIENIQVENRRKKALTYGLIGLTVDLTLVGLIIGISSSMSGM